MQKWEYKTITTGIDVEEWLNKLGQEEWELVSVVHENEGDTHSTFYFRRPIEE